MSEDFAEWIREVIRFHLDQHVANAVALGLRLRGVDVSTTHEAGLQDADDLAHLAHALAEAALSSPKTTISYAIITQAYPTLVSCIRNKERGRLEKSSVTSS